MGEREKSDKMPRYTAVHGQLLMPNLKKLKDAIEDAKDMDPDFDVVSANKWLRDAKRMGTWKWKPPKKKRRRVVKSKKKAFSHKDRRLAQEAAIAKRKADKIAAKKAREEELRRMVSVKQDTACSWQYIDHRSGKTYYCTNAKEAHPLLPDEGARFCKYHTKLCMVDHSRMGPDSRKFKQIEIPNRHALCDQCWHERLTGFPRKIDPLRFPGVYIIREENYKRLANVQAATTATDSAGGAGEDKEEPKCRFRKTNPSTMRPMFCSAPRMRHRITKEILFECGWHQKICIAAHTGKSPKIQVPNELGVCVAHYVAITGKRPEMICTHWTQIPTVGYKRSALRIAPKKHNLAPRGKPPWKVKEKMDETVEPVFDEDLDTFAKLVSYYARSTGAFIWSKIPPPPDPIQKIRFAIRAKLYIYRLRKSYPRNALIIQRNFRAYIGRERARLFAERRKCRLRSESAAVIQRLMRKFLGTYHANIFLTARKANAATINRVARGFLTRRRLRRHFAAIRIQKTIRGFLARICAGGKAILRGMENIAMDRDWAANVIWIAVRRWLARRHRTYWYVPDTSVEDAVILIQPYWRGWIGRQKAKRQAIWIRKYHYTIDWFQRWTRGYLARKYFSSDIQPRVDAARLFQRIWRGQKARRIFVKPEQAKLAKAWQWLNPTLPRDAFEQFLPRSAYDVRTGGQPATISREKFSTLHTPDHIALVSYLAMCKDGVDGVSLGNRKTKEKKKYQLLTSKQKKEARAKKRAAISRWPRGAFAQFDPEKSGVISKQQFRDALQLCGHYLSLNQVTALLARFDPSQMGWVNYENFLKYARAQDRPCSKHRAWGCALCVSHKHCLKCDCKRFVQEPSGGYLGYSEICECGHYSTMHLLEPLPNQDKEFKAGEGYTAKQLKHMLSYEGDWYLPESVKGSDLPRTDFNIAYTYQDLKATLNNVDDRVAGTMHLMPLEKERQSDHRGTEAYIGVFQHIISSIAETSANVLNDLGGQSGWNEQTKLLAKRTGEVIPTEEGSGQLSSISDSKCAPKISEAAKVKLAEIARLEKEQENRIKSDPRSTTSGIRERLAAAKDEGALLMHSVASNLSNLEIYETKFTLTRPLPFIGDKKLRMRVDTESMFIEVLFAFADVRMGLLEDEKLFAQYVYNIFTFLDRHWKKIVSSLRMGTVHHAIEIHPELKKDIESNLDPMPERSKLLDSKLKTLGFHRRASNAKFNETFLDKDDKEKESKSGTSTSNIGSIEETTRPSTSYQLQGSKRELQRHMAKAHSLEGLGLIDFQSTEREVSSARRPHSVQLHKRESLHADLLPDLNVQFHTTTINERFHDIATGPSARPIKIISEPRMTKPFVCDHPGCGKSFTDPRVARLHQQEEHENKLRLVAKNHAADQRLQAFWPEDVPWKTFSSSKLKEGKEKASIGKKYVSRITGKRFLQKKGLISHLRFQERYRSKLEDIPDDPNIQVAGEAVHVPPGTIPSRSPIERCSKHFVKLPGKCARCAEIAQILQPSLPCAFYQHVKIKWRLTMVPFKVQNYGRLPMVKTELGQCTPICIVAIAKDKLKNTWLAYSRFWKSRNLKRVNYKIRSDFWPKYELMEEKEVRWMRVTEVTGTCFVLAMSRNEFQRQKQNKELPKAKNVYFCKEVFSSRKAIEDGEQKAE
jgi:hypothetical protein